jgi:hypothetical protein
VDAAALGFRAAGSAAARAMALIPSLIRVSWGLSPHATHIYIQQNMYTGLQYVLLEYALTCSFLGIEIEPREVIAGETTMHTVSLSGLQCAWYHLMYASTHINFSNENPCIKLKSR